MHRRNSFLADAWKGLVFIVTIRAIAKHYRSRRLYLAER
jgi:hypothetical protein